MKKIAIVLLVLAVFSIPAYATPGAMPASLDNIQKGETIEDSLFATVQGTPLTQGDAALVEGEGLLGFLIGSIVGSSLCGGLTLLAGGSMDIAIMSAICGAFGGAAAGNGMENSLKK